MKYIKNEFKNLTYSECLDKIIDELKLTFYYDEILFFYKAGRYKELKQDNLYFPHSELDTYFKDFHNIDIQKEFRKVFKKLLNYFIDLMLKNKKYMNDAQIKLLSNQFKYPPAQKKIFELFEMELTQKYLTEFIKYYYNIEITNLKLSERLKSFYDF